MTLTIKIDSRQDLDFIEFSGDISEDSEVSLAELPQKISKKCIFHMQEISMVNSCGVRAWVKFMREISGKSEVVFSACSPAVVSQINMIPNFKGHADVKSLYCSYVCDNCDLEHLELFEEGKNMPKSSTEPAPNIKCKSCGEDMEMEEVSEDFFAWLDEE